MTMSCRLRQRAPASRPARARGLTSKIATPRLKMAGLSPPRGLYDSCGLQSAATGAYGVYPQSSR